MRDPHALLHEREEGRIDGMFQDLLLKALKLLPAVFLVIRGAQTGGAA